jgi:hypothetical protein
MKSREGAPDGEGDTAVSRTGTETEESRLKKNGDEDVL